MPLVAKGIGNQVRYIGLLAPQGIANVNNGVIYIDNSDSDKFKIRRR